MEKSAHIIFKARIIDFYAKNLWKFHRVFVQKHLAQRCQRCVNSEVYSKLDSRGICSVCCEIEKNPVAAPKASLAETSKADLERIMHTHSGSSGKYDALVMVSGGKDSAILMHHLKEKFPTLRQLAFTIDNGFMSPVALDNAKQTTAKLGIDHLVLRSAAPLFEKGFRYMLTNPQQGKGCFETVDWLDATLGFSLSKQYAALNKIPLILFGFNLTQMALIFETTNFEVPAEKQNIPTTERLGPSLRALYTEAELKMLWDPASFSSNEIPKLIAPLCVWNYNEDEVRNAVMTLGLIEKGNDSALVTNNSIIQLMVVMDYLRLGYADFEPQFSDMVRSGEADRLYWRNMFEILEYTAKTGWMIEKDLDKIAASLGVNRKELGISRI